MTPNQIAIAALMLATLVPLVVLFTPNKGELTIIVLIVAVCWWAKVKATF